MKVKCHNKKCLYSWDYNGDAKFYATCPRCHWNVNLNSEENKKFKLIKMEVNK